MESYSKNSKFYNLSHSETKKLIQQLKDRNNFYGGTPISFGFTSVIEFYSKNEINRINIAPHSFKIYQLDFEIPHNKKKEIESLGGAISFPFIKDDFAQFLTQLEEKTK